MKLPRHPATIACFSLLAALTPRVAANVTLVPPESAGFSAGRLTRIDQAMQRHIDAGEIAGAVTAVARGGKVVHFKTHGLLDLETKQPMPPDALFRIASMTKPVVAVAIMMLVEDGRLRLTDPVSRYLPEFKKLTVAVRTPAAEGAGASAGPIAFSTVAAAREITVRDLLTHTSGLGSGLIPAQELAKAPRKPDETLAAYTARLPALPLEFQPGTRWSYSPGAGFDVLGRVIEIVSGGTLAQFFQGRIFQPLGMKDTFFGPATAIVRVAPIYEKKDGKLARQPVTDPRFLPGNGYYSGGGGLTSTTEDYLRFGLMLAAGGEGNGHRLLAPASVELLRAAHIPDTLPGRTPGTGYGLGVRTITDRGAAGTMLSTGSYGWGGAFGTHFWVDPKTQTVAVLMFQITGNQADIRSNFEATVMQALIRD
ncbi:MAG: beta-lactamase family protein [Verrucomicrobia bacterium]|nr:beta-lactamase family protein [Verrucomicrobiota bacterium]